jgi:hypothetical protein
MMEASGGDSSASLLEVSFLLNVKQLLLDIFNIIWNGSGLIARPQYTHLSRLYQADLQLLVASHATLPCDVGRLDRGRVR